MSNVNLNLNEVNLAGRLGADVEITHLNGGGKVATMRLATSESWKDERTGDWKEKTEWHTVKTFNEGLIDNVLAKYAKKGAVVMIRNGQNKTRSYDKEGQTHYVTEVHLGFDGKFIRVADAPSNNNSQQGDDAGAGAGAGRGGKRAAAAASKGPKTKASKPVSGNDMDDDIPY